MFKITKTKQKNLLKIKVINISTGEYITIIPEFGAVLSEIVLLKSNELYSLLDGNLTLDSFSGTNIFKGAKLFPFPNRIKKGQYEFNEKYYSLPINYKEENNSVHGFVYNKQFHIYKESVNDNKAEISFNYLYNGGLQGFPFPFEIILTYLLHNKEGITLKTKVKNISYQAFPFGDGWHPFFRFGKKIDELYLKFDSKEIMITDKNLIPIGKKPFDLFNEFTKIGKTEFDNCFLLNSNKKIQTVEIYDQKCQNKILFWFESGKNKYNYLQIYTPPKRNSIAIEPMTCNINAFNNKEGLQILKPNKFFKIKCGIKLK